MAANRVKFTLDVEGMAVVATEGDRTAIFPITLSPESDGFKRLALYGAASYLQNSVASCKGEGLEVKGPIMAETMKAINTGVKAARKNGKTKEPSTGIAGLVLKALEIVSGMKPKEALGQLGIMSQMDALFAEGLKPEIARLEALVKGK